MDNINVKFNEYIDDNLIIDWKFDESLKSKFRLETQFKSIDINGKNIDFMSTGSGTRSLYLLSLLESYVEEVHNSVGKEGIFLIEEPELYLYPKLEKKNGKNYK